MAKPRRSRGEYRARQILEKELRKIDDEEKKLLPKPPEVKGPRAKFFERYKVEGYESAKSEINAAFNGKEVFNDETIIGWFEFKQNILDAYKKGKIEDAYKKADEINAEVGYPLVKKEYIDKWIEEERKKESKEVNQKNTGENDGSR